MTGRKACIGAALLAIGRCGAHCSSAEAASGRVIGAVPSVIQTRMDQDKKKCSSNDAKFLAGFLTSKDINRDGKPDYILDYSRYSCGGSTILFCGSAGCTTTVFASRGNDYVKVLDENVRSLTFRTIKGRPAMLLGLHGSVCGKAGSEPCGATLYWNGEKFSPAH